MEIAIVAFDDFTDIDVFLPWDLLNRVKERGWTVKIVKFKDFMKNWVLKRMN
jgi:putative intracellular protease/amidase